MRILRIFLIVFAVFLINVINVKDAVAHRVNIYAYVDGGDVQVECAFNKSNKVRQGAVTVFDSATNQVLTSGVTNDEGIFRFPVPQHMNGHGLRIHINAGEGHQNEWLINAESLNSSEQYEKHAASVPMSGSTSISTSGVDPTLSTVDLELIINKALDHKLAPLKQMLAEQYNTGPDIKDIIGGIGWIFGLVGVAAYFKRPGKNNTA